MYNALKKSNLRFFGVKNENKIITKCTFMRMIFKIKVFYYLPLVGKGNPSRAQVISGVGFPEAEHFSETAGPGCKVCSMNEYKRTGGASENVGLN